MREGTCFEVCLHFLTKSWISIRILSVAEAMIQDLPQRIAESEVIEAFDFDRAFCVSLLPTKMLQIDRIASFAHENVLIPILILSRICGLRTPLVSQALNVQ